MAVKKPVTGAHRVAPAKACHCSPNSHHPCTHTPKQIAARKAAAAKARKTNAEVKAKAEKILRTHPPTHAQIQAAVAAAKIAGKARAAKRAKNAAAKTAHAPAKTAKAPKVRKHAVRTPGGKAKTPAKLPYSILLAAEKSVRAQMAAAKAKGVKHRKAARKAVNPHTKPSPIARKKC